MIENNIIKIRFINYISSITLTINIKGTLNIFNYQNSDIKNLDKVIINGINYTDVKDGYYSKEKNNIIELIWKKKITSCNSMFSGCSNILTMDFSNFDTSEVTDMGSMFSGCSSLKFLDLSNFNTSSVTNMMRMFYGCSSLESINLYNFDTSKVISMYSMFEECSSIKYLNLANFNTSKVNVLFQCSKAVPL